MFKLQSKVEVKINWLVEQVASSRLFAERPDGFLEAETPENLADATVEALAYSMSQSVGDENACYTIRDLFQFLKETEEGRYWACVDQCGDVERAAEYKLTYGELEMLARGFICGRLGYRPFSGYTSWKCAQKYQLMQKGVWARWKRNK